MYDYGKSNQRLRNPITNLQNIIYQQPKTNWAIIYDTSFFTKCACNVREKQIVVKWPCLGNVLNKTTYIYIQYLLALI